MQIRTHQPFPTHPHVTTDEVVWTKRERHTLEQAVAVLENARDVVGTESEMGMDLGKASTVIGDWLTSD